MRLPDRLPSLQGRAGTVVQILYVAGVALIALIVAAGALCNGIVALRDLPAQARYGVKLGNAGGVGVIVAAADGSAQAAGVRVGDRVTAVGGAVLPPRATTIDAGARLAQATGPLAIDTAGPAGASGHHWLLRKTSLADARDLQSDLPLSVAGLITVAQPLLAGLLFLTLSLLLARKRPRDPEAMLLAFSFLLLAFGDNNDLWFWQLHPGLPGAAVSWTEAVLGVTGFWAMLVGICAFPDGRFATAWSRLAWWVPTTYVVANAATFFVLWRSPFATTAVDVLIFSIVVGSLLLRFRASPKGVQRQQLKWALFGGSVMVLSAIAGVLLQNDFVAAKLSHSTNFLIPIAYNSVESFAFPLGLMVSLLRYRLYDVDTVITRSTVYAILAVALVAMFACTEKVIELLGEEYFGHRLGALAGGLGAAISAVMVAPLHHRISHWVEHRFRHDLLHLRQSLPQMVALLGETATPTALAEAALHRVTHALHAGTGLVVSDAGQTLAAHQLARCDLTAWRARWGERRRADGVIDHTDPLLPVHIPLAVDGARPVGWLLLGPRPDGSLYGKDERDTLIEVAEPLARALSAALRHKALRATVRRERARHRQEREDLIGRLEEIERAVANLARPPRVRRS